MQLEVHTSTQDPLTTPWEGKMSILKEDFKIEFLTFPMDSD